jgi:hypothetical protein
MKDKRKPMIWHPSPIFTTLRRRDIPGGGNPNVRYRRLPGRMTTAYRITLPPEE